MILRSNGAKLGSYNNPDVSLRSISVSRSKMEFCKASVYPGAQSNRLNTKANIYAIVDVEGRNIGRLGIMTGGRSLQGSSPFRCVQRRLIDTQDGSKRRFVAGGLLLGARYHCGLSQKGCAGRSVRPRYGN